MNELTVYALTGMTRDASAQRRMVIQGFDIPARVFMVMLAAAGPALVITLIGWALVGSYAIVLLPAFLAGVFVLVEGRSRSGLRLRNYQALLDRKRASNGRWFVCGEEFDPLHGSAITIISSSAHRPVASLDEMLLAVEKAPVKVAGASSGEAHRDAVHAWDD